MSIIAILILFILFIAIVLYLYKKYKLVDSSTKIYFDTSGVNYLLENVELNTLLNTRSFQKTKNTTYILSVVILWELMLTSDDTSSDKLLFLSQNLFADKILASPLEITVRYILKAYPHNTINYDIYTNHSMQSTWNKMIKDNRVIFQYDKNSLKNRTKILRSISKNLLSIVQLKDTLKQNNELYALAETIDYYYNVLNEEGLFNGYKSIEDKQMYFKTSLVVIWTLLIMRQDIVSELMNQFWDNANITHDDYFAQFEYILITYPKLMVVGPIAEMSLMAYKQLQLGKPNRGLLLDAYHMIYAPYVDLIYTADENFSKLKNSIPQYRNKLYHVSELNIRYINFKLNS